MPRATKKAKTLLVIDNDKLLAKILKHKLGDELGMKVEEVTRLDEILPTFRRTKPDIVVVDPIMDDGSAFDVLERVPGIEASKLIFLTNLTGETDKERAKKMGCTHYLNKVDSSFKDITYAVVADASK